MPRKPPTPNPGTLVAKIVTSEEAYYIAEHPDLRRVDDEVSLNIIGRIERISLPRHQKDVGREIDIALRCARSYNRDEPTAPTNKPFMLALTLDKRRCLCMAYLPADAIWALSPRVTAGALTHVEITFGPLRYGSANILSLNLVPEGLVMPAA